MISVLLLKRLVVMCDINHEHDLGASIEVFVDSVKNSRAITYLENLHVLGFSGAKFLGTLMRGYDWSNFHPVPAGFKVILFGYGLMNMYF